MHLQRTILPGLAMMIALLTSLDARAQNIETLVMPGEVIQGHVELETECSSCHKMFDKEGQKQLCLDCHEEISSDIDQNFGYHGLGAKIESNQCSSCHTEHKGRDALIAILNEDTFDHQFTDFGLEGKHTEAPCSDCHAADVKHRETPSQCVGCHREDEPHQDRMGTDCTTCHTPVEWLDAEFDHDATDYALLGKHIGLACLDCHEDRTFPDPPTACIDCHAEDDAHNGRSGSQCANCHNPSDWKDTSFDHFRDTNFEMLGKHGELSCGDCHSETPFEDALDMACASCHLEDDNHNAHNGNQCDTCHSSNSWPEIRFNHDTDTDYKLFGAHKQTDCADCHVEPIFEVSLATTCDSCHAGEDPHQGSLGASCENCHTEVTWQDPIFFDHDLTSFPLLGVHSTNECEDCHTTQVYTDVDDECDTCHSDDDPHRGNFTGNCDSCHNPVGWDLWTFDHNLQTDFELGGAHVSVACNDCHRRTLGQIRTISANCGSCHRPDDIHDNEFGGNCGRCHSTESFDEVRTLQ
jgi:hypothetical protein